MTTAAVPSPTAPSTPAGDSAAPAPASADGGSARIGGLTDKSSVDDIMKALGVADDFGAEDSDGEVPAVDATGKADKVEAKPDGEAADAGASPDGTKDRKEPAEDADVTDVKAILARSAARRRARERSQTQARGSQAPAAVDPKAAAPAAATGAAAEAGKTPAAQSAPAGVAAAVQDVLHQIAKLAGDDAAADSATAAGRAPETTAASRTAALTAIQEQVAAIAKNVEGGEALKGMVDELKTRVESHENERFVRSVITKHIDGMESEIPTLAARRDAVDLVDAAMTKFYTKYKSAPSVRELARRIEKHLAGKQPPRSSTQREAPTTRKTVSSSLGSPPAARTGPDTRSKAQIEADLYARFGVEPDGEEFG